MLVSLTNKVFGKLKVLEESERYITKSGSYRQWLCICECGNKKTIHQSNLTSGKSKSCGCLSKEKASLRFRKHGFTVEGSIENKIYKRLAGIIRRCHNKKDPSYERYGKKGIHVCSQWKNDPSKFIDWSLKNGFSEDLDIDRIDSSKGYTPDNCRYVTRRINNLNKKNKMSTNTSGYTGVSYDKIQEKFIAYITVNKKQKYLGRFFEKIDAVNARNNYIINNNLEKDYLIQRI